MKKTLGPLGGLFVLAIMLAFAMPAQARWEIKQKDTGAAVWSDGSVDVPTGYPGLVVHITEAGTASTWYAISHKKGTITKVYAVANSSTVVGSTLNEVIFKIGTGENTTWTPVSALTLSISNTAGRKTSGTPTLTGIGATKVTVDQGDVIAVATNGSGTTQDATIVIVIE